MAKIPQRSLFSWRDVDAPSDLDRLRRVLEEIPGGGLEAEAKPEEASGRAMWSSVVAGLVYGHETLEELVRELRRNAGMRELCGFERARGAEAVPAPAAYARLIAQMRDRDEVLERVLRAVAAKGEVPRGKAEKRWNRLVARPESPK